MLKAKGSETQTKDRGFGYGEGGMIALYAAALDPRIEYCLRERFLRRSERRLEEPSTGMFRTTGAFGDAEVASLIAPRTLVVEASRARIRRSRRGPAGPGRSDHAEA